MRNRYKHRRGHGLGLSLRMKRAVSGKGRILELFCAIRAQLLGRLLLLDFGAQAATVHTRCTFICSARPAGDLGRVLVLITNKQPRDAVGGSSCIPDGYCRLLAKVPAACHVSAFLSFHATPVYAKCPALLLVSLWQLRALSQTSGDAPEHQLLRAKAQAWLKGVTPPRCLSTGSQAESPKLQKIAGVCEHTKTFRAGCRCI